MAFQAAAAWPGRLALVSFLGPFSAAGPCRSRCLAPPSSWWLTRCAASASSWAGVFTKGILSESCNWKVLREELAQRFPDDTPAVQVRV